MVRKIRFVSHIKKGNKNGTGLFYMPKNKLHLFNKGDRFLVELFANKRFHFFAKGIEYANALGAYIPKQVVLEGDLLNKAVTICIHKIDGFYTRMYTDGRIYIPKDVIQKQKLNENDIVVVRGIENDKIVREKYSKINTVIREERGRVEYSCIFDKNFYGKELLFQVKKQKKCIQFNRNPELFKILRARIFAHIAQRTKEEITCSSPISARNASEKKKEDL